MAFLHVKHAPLPMWNACLVFLGRSPEEALRNPPLLKMRPFWSGVVSLAELSWLDWDAEVSFRSSSRHSPASPFLTASLFAAPELLREARRGTIVRPDYGGYCCVLWVPTSL
ncbi:hypothetical protein Taro_029853 [Colocasia esculenta]|uniref:Uncharacterized protein n=1 Tax=Colocasia esculenta TaxID=4460 RepID=A0A843VMG0_COLES|nr:hypothetical protein [Colocasia esculenta]